MDLSKFKVYNIVSGLSTISITKNGMTLSKNAIIKMGKPNYIQLMINSEDKKIAIIECEKSDDGSIPCVTDKANPKNFRINNKDLIYTIATIMNCEYDKLSLKIVGDWHEENKIMLVDLNRATEANEKEEDED